MSDPVIVDFAVRDRATSLRHSGPVWRERVAPAQRDFIRQLSLAAASSDLRTNLAAAGDWLRGQPAVRGSISATFTHEDVRLVGPGYWGYTAPRPGGSAPRHLFDTELQDLRASTDMPFLLDDGRVLVVSVGSTLLTSGDAEVFILTVFSDGEEWVLTDTEGTALLVTDAESVFQLSRETAWFLRLPPDLEPLALETALGDFLEGAAFSCHNGWLLLRESPWVLWPDGVMHATSARWTPPCVRHRALRTDLMRTSGRHVANYKRAEQSAPAFLRAMAEVATIPVFVNDTVIESVVPGRRGVVHHCADGSRFALPRASGYVSGSVLHAGDVAGGLLQLRHESLQGAFWWQARPWGALGIPISAVRPGFSGFSLRDTWVDANAYLDPVGGGLRARVIFGQDPEEEARFWAWQAKTERQLGTEHFARVVLGFTAAGQGKLINPLELWAGMLGSWLFVVEDYTQNAYADHIKEMRDFITREKPAGSLVFVAIS